MKKYLLVLLMLSGCASIDKTVDAFLMKFDTNEYRLITDIRTTAELGKDNCSDQTLSKNTAQQLYFLSTSLKNYSENLPHNKPIQVSAKEMNDIVNGLNKQYQSEQKVSEFFCKIKMDTIVNNAIIMQQMEGGKPR